MPVAWYRLNNYDPDWDILDFDACDFTSCVGCTDEAACNYEADNTQDNGSCEYPEKRTIVTVTA